MTKKELTFVEYCAIVVDICVLSDIFFFETGKAAKDLTEFPRVSKTRSSNPEQ
jgi:hypothetical protein